MKTNITNIVLISLVMSLLVGGVTGCAEDADLTPIPDDVVKTHLGPLIGEQSAATGIAIDPRSGQRYVLDPVLGIMEVRSNGDVVSLWSPPAELPTLTDLCAVGGGRFIAAADGDGYIVDVAAGAARQHFCLEPGWDPGFEPSGETRHLNRSVACDLEAGLIYGQPQTVLREDESQTLRSEVASYLLTTGADHTWRALPTANYHAGGMTMLRTGLILMGSGSDLSVFNIANESKTHVSNLSRFGIEQVEALTTDHFAQTLIVVDGADNTMVEIPLAHIGL